MQGGTDNQRLHQFQKCHLQILRSLYNDNRSCASEERIDDNKKDCIDSNNQIFDLEECPVSSEIWELIERFIHQRREYLPQLKRQIYWNEIYLEATSSRDNYFHSRISSQQEPSINVPSSVSPRKIFSAVKRRSTSTPNNNNNLYLTPLTNNRIALTSSNNNSHELSDISIRSWNFISRVVKQREDACTKSCDSLRSEPFLRRLLDEAKARCMLLEVSLQALKHEMAAKISHIGKKRDSATIFSTAAKRVKFDRIFDSSQEKCVTGVSFFKGSEPFPETMDPTEVICADSFMQKQIKLKLWLSLSKSVEQIIEVDKK